MMIKVPPVQGLAVLVVATLFSGCAVITAEFGGMTTVVPGRGSWFHTSVFSTDGITGGGWRDTVVASGIDTFGRRQVNQFSWYESGFHYTPLLVAYDRLPVVSIRRSDDTSWMDLPFEDGSSSFSFDSTGKRTELVFNGDANIRIAGTLRESHRMLYRLIFSRGSRRDTIPEVRYFVPSLGIVAHIDRTEQGDALEVTEFELR